MNRKNYPGSSMNILSLQHNAQFLSHSSILFIYKWRQVQANQIKTYFTKRIKTNYNLNIIEDYGLHFFTVRRKIWQKDRHALEACTEDNAGLLSPSLTLFPSAFSTFLSNAEPIEQFSGLDSTEGLVFFSCCYLQRSNFIMKLK